MRNGRIAVLALLLLSAGRTTEAQVKLPIGRFVADVRGASIGLPTAVGWTPVVPTGTILPSRGLGVDVGAHVYLLRFRRLAIGIGGNWLTARSTTTPPEPASGTTTPPPPVTTPDVTTTFRSVASQVSLNFGHSLGWSYVSAGLGRSRVESGAVLVSTTTLRADVEFDSVKTLNWGGGARWFVTDHVGVGFDLRWHKLNPQPATNTRPGAGRTSVLVAGAGLVLK